MPGRSRSPKLVDRRRSRSRSRDRRRKRSSRSRSPRDRSTVASSNRDRDRTSDRKSSRRSRSRSRDRKSRRSRSRERGGRDKSRKESSQSQKQPKIEDLQDIPVPEDEEAMKKLMGFGSFDSTKGKHVEGNDVYVAGVHKPRKYRQYMNRRGGFNRPLDAIM